MNFAPALEFLATGALFGLSAGLAPGPLLALVMSQTLRHGPGQGVRVAMAPLLTDVPIVVICTVLVGVLTGSSLAMGAVALAGSGVVAWLAWDTWRAEPPTEPGEGNGAEAQPAPRSWSRGAIVNALSPHPWLFWMAIGAPTLLAAFAAGGVPAAASFLVGFYACLIGSKVGIAVLVGGARGRVTGRGYRWVMRVLAVLLGVFAMGLLREAAASLLGV